MDQLNDVQITLLAARTLIADPECWTQGYYARTRSKGMVWHGHPRACQWCAIGANLFASPTDRIANNAIGALQRAIKEVAPDTPLVEYNDGEHRTHTEIIAAFDRAIELAGQS